ncbi:MAG: rod shape-determining protein MreC [Omnitrophica bacterium RIFCSPLOWO2_12_FULL_50_11]|nr:MAG: rod shape-determining protein MreC [Omnitrophica bacterium RIFCSPLOWO2_12_FULL_50_11]
MQILARWKRPLILAGAVSFPLLIGAAHPPLAEQVRSLTTSALGPFLGLQSGLVLFLKSQTQTLLELPSLRERNVELQTQIQDLKAQLTQFDEMKSENTRLVSLLQLKADLPKSAVAAHVVGRDPSHWSHYITIDKGSKQGVHEDTVLLHPDGLVGKVISGGPFTSRAILLVDRHSRVSAMNQRTRDVGLIEGTDALDLRMTYLDRDAKIEVGDTVVSSGLGGIYPKGIPIGKVLMIGEADDDLMLYAIVKPFVPFSRLEEVLCVSKQTVD